MDAFCAYTSSSSSSSSSFLAKKKDQSEHQIVKREFSSYSNNNIHCVRKPMAKPWKKPAIAPLPPTRPRVYKVDPINFRGLVQKLTGLAELRSPRLQKMAPPPLDISRRLDSCSAAVEATVFKASPLLKVENEVVDGGSFLELNLSPFNKNWCSFPALSPETLAILDAI